MDITAYQQMNIRMSTRGKRPLRNLTPSDKVRAIQRIHNGETKASVSRDIGVPESTLRGWCKNEQKLRFMCQQLGADHLVSNDRVEAPPEKRLKFVGGSSPSMKLKGGAKNAADFGYNRLQPAAPELAPSNAILENMAIDELIRNFSLPQEPPTRTAAALPPAFSQPFVPAEYLQPAMLQKLNLLALLNPSLTTAPTLMSTGQGDGGNPSFPSPAANTVRSTDAVGGSSILSVKNWAKDPATESVPGGATAAAAPSDNNNNNDAEINKPSTADLGPTSAAETLFSTAVPTCGGPFPGPFGDLQSSNVALMDWCKLFNASLHYLALSAAAAALQPAGTTGESKDDAVGKESRENAADNILYKHLTKNFMSLPESHLALTSTDASNDSYFDSEPEDLSMPSTSSKMSSSTSSRSQSPTHLPIAFSAHGDFE